MVFLKWPKKQRHHEDHYNVVGAVGTKNVTVWGSAVRTVTTHLCITMVLYDSTEGWAKSLKGKGKCNVNLYSAY